MLFAGGLPTINIPRRQIAHYEQTCAARIHHIIQAAFPGHPFEVTVSLNEMRAVIDHPLLPRGMAITVKLTEEDPDGKIYVRYCGELLERFRIPRAGIDAVGGTMWIDPAEQAAALSDIK